MRRRRNHLELVGPVLLVALLSACGATTAAVPTLPIGTLGGVGELPEPLTAGVTSPLAPVGSIVPRATIARVEAEEPVAVAALATGPRVLMIGDSITASASRRYGGELCDLLVPAGWTLEANAEVGRFIGFGDRVLDRRMRPQDGVDWDVVVIALGSNFDGDAAAYRAQLHRILDRVAPRPTVLLTVSEFRRDRAEVNEVIRDMLRYYAGVQVLEWAEITAAEPALLQRDRLHLSDAGRLRFAEELLASLGTAPLGEDEPACLSTSFTDDSIGRPAAGAVAPPGSLAPRPTQESSTTSSSSTTSTTLDGGGSTGGGSSGGGSSGGGSSGGGSSGGGGGGGSGTVTSPAPTTPSPPGSSPVTQPPASQPPASQPPATQPPITQPPITQPPITQPPITQPPATQPPSTQPPTTDAQSEPSPGTAPPTTKVPVEGSGTG